MDPHFDDELKEYLKLIDATVKSATTNHISPQRSTVQISPQVNLFLSNEQISSLTLINSHDQYEIKNQLPQRKKPQILDDSISDWNVGSQQTTLESPKSLDDIKDLSNPTYVNGVNSYENIGQNYCSFINGQVNQTVSQKSNKNLQEQQNEEHFSCLCSLDQQQKPSRNLIIELNQQEDVEQVIAYARGFGDIQNIDSHKLLQEKVIVITYFSIATSMQAFQQMSTVSCIAKLSYLSDLNDFDYIDYLMVQNASRFNQKLVIDYLECFGNILDYSSFDSQLVVRYFDVRSLKEIDRIIQLQEKDRKQFTLIHQSKFPDIEENIILELLKNVFIFSKENKNNIMIKNTRVKQGKTNYPQQTSQKFIKQQPFQNDFPEINSLQKYNVGTFSQNNSTSFASSSEQIQYFKFENKQDVNSNSQQIISSNSDINDEILTNFFNFEESSPQITKSQSENTCQMLFNQQKGISQQQIQLYQQFGDFYTNQDYQNYFNQKKQQTNQNRFIDSQQNKHLNENYVLKDEMENTHQLYASNSLTKIPKKMNPKANNFVQKNNYFESENSLQQSFQNFHFSNGDLFCNYNSQQKSQDENSFQSQLRMSFDNNPNFQVTNDIFQSFNQSINCNNKGKSNNSTNLKNNKQIYQQSQLNCPNSFMNAPNILNNNISNNQIQQSMNNNGNYLSQISNKQNNNPNAKSKVNNENFQVVLENITNMKDRRATIMVRNIPNRYNQEDFLRIIDINFKGLYDFVYLPMDFKIFINNKIFKQQNHCNIGYAFINFIDPKHIIPFYNEFNAKKWETIRSEKVCYICYARIQGRNELIAHFKKSGVMSQMVDNSFKPLILPNPKLDLQLLQY